MKRHHTTSSMKGNLLSNTFTFLTTCYIVRDGENLDNMKEKGDPCNFVDSKLVSNIVPIADETDTSLQEMELLFSPMYEEYFNEGYQGVSKSSALSNNL
ncbi:hypothetical protein Tco_1298397 [Tanacetum coccineum]